MSMAEELADTHAAESADIGAVDSGVIGRETPVERAPSDKPVSIRDGLNAAIKEVGEKEARARDEKTGKFAPKSKEAPLAAASTEIPAKEKDISPTPSKGVGIPPGFSTETKAFLDTLPPDHPIKRDLEKRESEISTGFKTKSDELKRYQDLEQVLAPLRPSFQRDGAKSDAEAIRNLASWADGISNPATRIQAFQALAQRAGIDLQSLAQGSPQAHQGQEIPEHLRPVLDQFGQLSQTVTSLESRIQQADQEKIADTLSTFAKDKPHFERVRVRMGQMMAAGIADPKDLNGAYEQAMWADPELRNELLKEQDEKRKAEFTKAQTDAGSRARLAAVSPAPRARVGAPVANGHDKGGKGVRASLLNSIKELEEDTRA